MRPALALLLLLAGCSRAQVQVYFCQAEPGTCGEVMIAEITEASQTIDAASYAFTHEGIAEALEIAASRGVEVRLVYDNLQSSNNSMSEILANLRHAGVETRAGTSPVMHHKFLVIDGRRVVAGSFNFTNAGDWVNDENLMVMHSRSLAHEFQLEFHRLWTGG